MRLGGRRHAEYLLPREHDCLERILSDYLQHRHELRQIAHRQETHDAELRKISLRCCVHHDLKLASWRLKIGCCGGRSINRFIARELLAVRATASCTRFACCDPSRYHRRTSAFVQRDSAQGVLFPAWKMRSALAAGGGSRLCGDDDRDAVQQCQHSSWRLLHG